MTLRKPGTGGLLTLAAAVLLSVSAAEAKMVYVDAVNGNDAWDGLCEEWDGGTCGPKATLQAAVNATVSGDVVQAADGLYEGYGNRSVSYGGKAITIRSKNGPANCVVSGTGADEPAFRFTNGEGSDSVLDGFMVKDCYGC